MLSWEETEAYDQGVEASFIIHTFMTYLKTQDFYVNLSETKHVVRIHPWYETTPGCHVPRLKGSFPMETSWIIRSQIQGLFRTPQKLLAKFKCHCIHEATGDESNLKGWPVTTWKQSTPFCYVSMAYAFDINMNYISISSYLSHTRSTEKHVL